MGEIVSESTISRSLHKAGLYCTVELVPVSTESSSSVSSPDDDIGAKMVKPDGEACASHLVPQNKAETVVALEEPVKKKRGRKPLPPELRVKKLLKTPSKALPRQPKPSIKKPLLPDSFTGITRSSRNLLDVLSGQSSRSSGQGAPQASAGSSNEQKKSKKSKELPVELKDTIVQRHISGEGYKTISKSLNISSSTIGSIIRKWKVHCTTETLPRSGCPSKLSNQARNRLVSEATVRPTVTLKELKSSIAEMGENVSESTISRSLHKAGLYCTVDLVPLKTESSISVSSPDDDDDISAKMVKLDGNTCASDTVLQTKEQTAEAKEEPVKKKRGRKPLPPELRVKKLLKTPSKVLPRQPKPSIKKPLLPESFTGITRSSRNLLDGPSGQSSSSSGQGQGAPHASAGSPNGQQKAKKGKELPVELRDKIVERHKSGEGYKKISKSLNISSSTVRSIILKWKVHHTTETLPRSGCPSKLSKQARSRLVSEATVRPTVTLKELKSSIAEMGENVSESTISRSLHKAGLYCKVAKRKVQIKERCLMQSQQDVSSSQHHPCSEVLWWEHYVKDILRESNNEASQE
ncbi:hypothetical protein COCON_G00027870 [Conger conger]|uniref:Transposase Tc1-like domain-containing protein n=2 Tax=Conger conger TaxID=82655 RepID=A0A9Q1DY76_CONCO|nr:hypothetical protein COCON_G00027870 [Conger conger]